MRVGGKNVTATTENILMILFSSILARPMTIRDRDRKMLCAWPGCFEKLNLIFFASYLKAAHMLLMGRSMYELCNMYAAI